MQATLPSSTAGADLKSRNAQEPVHLTYNLACAPPMFDCNMTQQRDQDGLVMEQPELTMSTTAGSTCNPETTLSGALASGEGQDAAEESLPYSTETNVSSETLMIPCTAPTIAFMDFHGREFRLPMKDCSSIDSARTLVAEEMKLENDSFEFWVRHYMVTGHTWASEAKPGAMFFLRASVTSGLFPVPAPRSPRFPPTPPPTPPPETSASPPIPAPLLKQSQIWSVVGLYTLPFSGCGSRTFRFIGHSIPTSVESLNLFQILRERAPPERWSDLHGNVVACGRVTALDHPQVNIGPVLAGVFSEQQDIRDCRYVLIRKAELTRRPREKDLSGHLHGDSIYQWVSYPSREHAQIGLVESLGLGYSIVGNWAELNVRKVRKARLAQLIGIMIVVEKRKFFAVVDAVSLKGWRRKLHLVRAIAKFLM